MVVVVVGVKSVSQRDDTREMPCPHTEHASMRCRLVHAGADHSNSNYDCEWSVSPCMVPACSAPGMCASPAARPDLPAASCSPMASKAWGWGWGVGTWTCGCIKGPAGKPPRRLKLPHIQSLSRRAAQHVKTAVGVRKYITLALVSVQM